MNKDELLIISLVDECLQMHIETMDEFSQWLVDNDWELNYTTGVWEKVDNLYHSMSEIYQLFLKSKEA